MEKENKTFCQRFASQNPLLKKLTHKNLLSTLKDSSYLYEQIYIFC